MWGQAQGGREGGDGDLMNVTDDENFDSWSLTVIGSNR